MADTNTELKITNLKQLKDWNKNPTTEPPILMEWFMDWFMKLLEKENFKKAIIARAEYVRFAEICENMNTAEATERVDRNLRYYSGYSCTRWFPAWEKLQSLIGTK